MFKLNLIILIVAGVFLSSFNASSQNLTLSGRFMDGDDTAYLIGVTVLLTNTQDSTKNGWTTSDDKGYFLINNLYSGVYNLRATYMRLVARPAAFEANG